MTTMMLPVLLWVFHVSVSTLDGIKVPKSCDSNMSSTSGTSYVPPAQCQSQCQPRETLVSVWHEFPDEIEHTFLPCSVPVQRCGGYCRDEATVCMPVKNYTVLLQVKRDDDDIIELPFVYHDDCRCRARKHLTGGFA